MNDVRTEDYSWKKSTRKQMSADRTSRLSSTLIFDILIL